ncbi:acylphosphatase [Candidatus Parcubacteria bacterium]|nr:acylphosphatase [Candidatus Parcubacteria bacterium]
MKKRAHVLVSGKVQGVFFRQNTFQRAKKLGLFGWVCNTKDGRVEAVFEGEEEKIKEILEWIKIGPPLAKVEKVDITWEEFKGEFKDFEIRYF